MSGLFVPNAGSVRLLREMLDSVEVAPPLTALAVAPAGGGAVGGLLPAGTYYLAYSHVNATGESVPSPFSSVFTVAAGQIPRITLPVLPSGVRSFSLYLSSVNQSAATATRYASSLAAGVYDLAAAAISGDTPLSEPTIRWPEDLRMHLLGAAITPSEADVVATYQPDEAFFVGYTAKALTRRVSAGTYWTEPTATPPTNNWSPAGNTLVAQASYAPQTWMSSSPEVLYGYWIQTALPGDGDLIGVERFSSSLTLPAGTALQLTPRLGACHS